MTVVNGLMWDDWNKKHLAKHGITIGEVEEVCRSKYQAVESYRGRIQLTGKTMSGKRLTIILSPEDRRLKEYGDGIYYLITAFEGVKS